jgi:spore maturation protein SpmA
VQKSDGLLPTCKSTLLDLVLPLMAYLAFWVDGALIISVLLRKIGQSLKSCFCQSISEYPKNHPSISYMTLNFAANFLGLDSAATPLD